MRLPRKLLLGLSLLATAAVTPAYGEFEDYQPAPLSAYDFNKNPGCGKKGLSRTDKIKRNIALAELFFQSYLDGRERGVKKRGWREHGCLAKDATILIGIYNPPPSKPAPFAQLLGSMDKMEEDIEFKRWRQVFPNFGVVPGTFRIMAVDQNTITWVNSFGGPEGDLVTKDGEHFPAIWEVELLRVNEEGLITHYESWTDPLTTDKAFRKIFGKSFVHEGKGYFEQLRQDHSKDKTPQKQ